MAKRSQTKAPHPPNRLRELRVRAGLTQAQLAEPLGVGHTTIAKLEASERGLDIGWMEKLAPLLGCEPWEFLNSAPRLTADERALIALYDSLSQEGRAEIWNAVRREARYHGVEIDDLDPPAEPVKP